MTLPFQQAVVLETPNWRKKIPVPLKDDVQFERFFEAAQDTGIVVLPCHDLQEVERDPSQPRVVILCLADSDVGSPELETMLDILARRSEPVIAYADVPGEWADVPVDWCHRGLVMDFLVRGARAPNCVLEQHAMRLFRGDPIYPRIPARPRIRWPGTPSVFIATPLGESFEVMVEGCLVPAIKKAGFEPQWCLSRLEGRNFQEQVCDQIRKSALFIALAPQDAKPQQLHNVYYETGCATAWKKRTLIAAEASLSGAQSIPVDLQSQQRILYNNPIDLALQIYFGLR